MGQILMSFLGGRGIGCATGLECSPRTPRPIVGLKGRERGRKRRERRKEREKEPIAQRCLE